MIQDGAGRNDEDNERRNEGKWLRTLNLAPTGSHCTLAEFFLGSRQNPYNRQQRETRRKNSKPLKIFH